MSLPFRLPAALTAERLRAGLGRRTVGLVLAVLLELLLALMLLTLGRQNERRKEADMALTTFEVAPEAKAPEAAQESPPENEPQRPRTPRSPRAPDAPASPVAPKPPEQIWPWLQLNRQDMAAADLTAKPRPAAPVTPAKPQTYGPSDPGAPGDSQRVGTAPGGQPLYAAAWYREPSDDELRGYLSTADPGWALIACRTVPDFRVEDCVALDEYPSGSRLARAVLAAAWQFRVRPPRIGGRYQVGEWVRIRIDYNIRRRDPGD